jgi:hypothetical protein
MADTGKNSPLGVNVTGDYMNNTGFNINPVAQSYMGTSKKNNTYSFGSCVSGTCLRLLTWAINDAYTRGVVLKTTAGTSVYDNLISIGSSTIPGLGNSCPPTYIPLDPANVWASIETNPLAKLEAEGMLKVCVEPLELILKSVPVVPVANVWTSSVRPFNAVIPVPAIIPAC